VPFEFGQLFLGSGFVCVCCDSFGHLIAFFFADSLHLLFRCVGRNFFLPGLTRAMGFHLIQISRAATEGVGMYILQVKS